MILERAHVETTMGERACGRGISGLCRDWRAEQTRRRRATNPLSNELKRWATGGGRGRTADRNQPSNHRSRKLRSPPYLVGGDSFLECGLAEAPDARWANTNLYIPSNSRRGGGDSNPAQQARLVFRYCSGGTRRGKNVARVDESGPSERRQMEGRVDQSGERRAADVYALDAKADRSGGEFGLVGSIPSALLKKWPSSALQRRAVRSHVWMIYCLRPRKRQKS